MSLRTQSRPPVSFRAKRSAPGVISSGAQRPRCHFERSAAQSRNPAATEKQVQAQSGCLDRARHDNPKSGQVVKLVFGSFLPEAKKAWCPFNIEYFYAVLPMSGMRDKWCPINS